MESTGRKWQSQVIIGAILIIVLYSVWTFIKGESYTVTVGVDEEKVGIAISNEDTIFISFEDIKTMELVENLDVGEQQSGIDLDDFKYGIFENDSFGTYTMCYYPNVTSYIVIVTNEKTIVFNESSAKRTENSFELLEDMMQNN